MIAWSFGRRASNSSATRGRPPVMSRSWRFRAGYAPARRRPSPSRPARPTGSRRPAAGSAHRRRVRQLDDLALARPGSTIAGRRSRAARRRAPVDDDALGDAGRLVGLLAHRDAFDQILEGDLAVDLGDDRPRVGVPLGERWPRLTCVALVDLAAARRRCTRCVARSLPASSTITTAMLRPMTISSPSELRTTLRLRDLRPCPRRSTSMNDCSATCAAPPMWKVRMVSCVPGSPIDCAAMTPTASPMLTGVPRARSRP